MSLDRSAPAEPTPVTSSNGARARAHLRDWVEAGTCLGGQIFAWRDGVVVSDVAEGWSGIDRPAAVDDLVRMYCGVKPLSAICVLRAAEEGALDLEAPVGRLLPEYAAAPFAAVTVRSLLDHSSGLMDHSFRMTGRRYRDVARLMSRYTMNPALWYRTPSYNDTVCWSILAVLIERVYGSDFEQVVTDVVCEPLGLPHLRISAPDPARRVHFHRIVRGEFVPIEDTVEVGDGDAVNPAHGGFTTARDLGLVYADLVQSFRDRGRLLRAASVATLLERSSVVDLGPGLGTRRYGLGVVRGVTSDGVGGNWSDLSAGHAGYVSQYRALHAFADFESGVAVCVVLFSIGAKNSWRFKALTSALACDLQLRVPQAAPVEEGMP